MQKKHKQNSVHKAHYHAKKQPLSIKQLLQKAKTLYGKGHLTEAEKTCRLILFKTPGSGEAYHLLGLIAHRTGRNDLAITLTRQSTLLTPTEAEFYFHLGIFKVQDRQIDKALDSYRKAIALRPDFSEAHYNLANLLFRQGKFSEAAQSYRDSIKIKPAVDSLCNLGSCLQALQINEEACACFEQALSLHPERADIHTNLGNILKRLNRLEEALACQKKAVALQPGSSEIHCNLGIVLQEMGRLKEASDCYHRALAIKPDSAEALHDLGKLTRETKQPDAALDLFRQALTCKSDYIEAHFQLGNTLKELLQLDEAALCYERALAIRPDFLDALLGYGDLLLLQNRTKEALAIAENCRKRENCTTAQHYSLGIFFAKCSMQEEALLHFAICLEREPEDRRGVRLLMAAAGSGSVPDRPSEEFIRLLYAKRSHYWNRDRQYFAPELVAAALAEIHTTRNKLDILDAGCGTGLVGTIINDFANKLDGVDLSEEMLSRARSLEIYSQLHQGDLVSYMAGCAGCYQAIVSAATLLHFGDLEPVFKAATVALAHGGIFIFTLFTRFSRDMEGLDMAAASLDGLAQGGCYLHSREYVTRTAANAGFTVEMLEDRIHEYDQSGSPVMGTVVALRLLAPGQFRETAH